MQVIVRIQTVVWYIYIQYWNLIFIKNILRLIKIKYSLFTFKIKQQVIYRTNEFNLWMSSRFNSIVFSTFQILNSIHGYETGEVLNVPLSLLTQGTVNWLNIYFHGNEYYVTEWSHWRGHIGKCSMNQRI